MLDIGKPPTVGRLDEAGRYVIEPEALGPFQPGTITFS
jgi:hypothetical protein